MAAKQEGNAPVSAGEAGGRAGWAWAVAALGLVAAVYAPSLAGGWVWDDRYILATNPAVSDLGRFLSEPVFGDSDVYRPLAMLSHWIGQSVAPGPLVERVGNLGIHLVSVGMVAALAMRLGATTAAAWIGAALFGVHAGASEAVAWIAGRHDLLGSALFLGGALALSARRDALAGVLLALAPFAKETFLLAPVATVALLLGQRRADRGAFVVTGLSLAGVLAYVALRAALHLPLPVGAAGAASLASVGAVATRGAKLLFVPAAADALPLYTPAPAAGPVAIVGVLVAAGLSRGRGALALLVAAAIFLAPVAPVAVRAGLVGDRYFYVAFAIVGVLAGVGLSRVWSRPAARALVAVPLLLAPLTFVRAAEWRSDAEVFGASLARDPRNPHAAFHVAHDLQTRAGDCEAAIPLYRLAMDVERRALNNLQGCLLETGRIPEAMALGERAARGDPGNPTPAANAARAFALGGDPTRAVDWAAEAVKRSPDDPALLVLFGNVLGQVGKYRMSLAAFERALGLDPGSVEARRGADLARAKLEGG